MLAQTGNLEQIGAYMQIVVASSNLFRRELSSFILSEAGYTVHEVENKDTLLQCLERMCPDMVLLDTPLLDHHIQEVVSSLRQYKSVPVLFLINGVSSFSTPPVLERYGDACVHWPYQAENFLSQVRTLLHRCVSDAPASPPVMSYQP